jgi:hypothetical protein
MDKSGEDGDRKKRKMADHGFSGGGRRISLRFEGGKCRGVTMQRG